MSGLRADRYVTAPPAINTIAASKYPKTFSALFMPHPFPAQERVTQRPIGSIYIRRKFTSIAACTETGFPSFIPG
jgi:hypothetical protein